MKARREDGGEDAVYLSQSPPFRASNQPLTSVSELLQLPGFGRERYVRLVPHVTALPPDASRINVCMATPYVLDALASILAEGESSRLHQALRYFVGKKKLHAVKNAVCAC